MRPTPTPSPPPSQHPLLMLNPGEFALRYFSVCKFHPLTPRPFYSFAFQFVPLGLSIIYQVMLILPLTPPETRRGFESSPIPNGDCRRARSRRNQWDINGIYMLYESLRKEMELRCLKREKIRSARNNPQPRTVSERERKLR